MHNSNEIIAQFIGGIDHIVAALKIEHLSEQDQVAVVARFTSLLLKRILLRVPDAGTAVLSDALAHEDSTLFMEALSRFLPEPDVCINEEFARLVMEFQSMRQEGAGEGR